MKKIKSCLITLLFIAIHFTISAQSRIIGGTAINITQRPFQAAIYVDGTFYGGGVIISPEWILTAAHVVCNETTPFSLSRVKVTTGYTDLTSDTNRSTVQTIIVHPEYSVDNNGVPNNDIALVKLSTPLTFGANRQSVILSNYVSYPGQTSAIVSGWGKSGVGQSATTSQLYQANVTIKSCSNTQIVVNIANSTAYKGDSGGPLTKADSKWGIVLIGLVSYGSEFYPTSFTVQYTNVGYYHNWIRQQTGIDLPAITGNSIVHTDGYYGFSGLYCPATNASWSISNSNIATVNSSGRVVRNGMASGLVTLTASINNFGTPISLSRDLLIDLPPYKVDCVLSGQEVYRVGSTYPFYASPQWGGMIMSSIPLTYIWGYSSGPNGEGYVPVKTYNNTTFVDMQPTFTFNSSGTYRIEMRVQDDYGTSSANTKTITVIDSYFAVAFNGSGSQLTISPCEESLQTLTATRSASSPYIAQLYKDASLVRSLPLPATGDTFVDVSSLAKGIYYLAILKDNAVLERHKVLIR